MDFDDCPHEGEDRIYTLKLIPTNRPDWPTYPKYIPQVKMTCVCGKFFGFAKQEPPLIDTINKNLEGKDVAVVNVARLV